MPDKAFIDTNILIYFISSDSDRKAKAREVILGSSDAVISSQVISEFISTCLQKRLLTIQQSPMQCISPLGTSGTSGVRSIIFDFPQWRFIRVACLPLTVLPENYLYRFFFSIRPNHPSATYR